MNSSLQAIIGLSIVLVVFFAIYYATKENMIPINYQYSSGKLYTSAISYGVVILSGIAIIVLLAEVLK
jgi:hypothetical protein